jgi:type IV pilus assembly protein PilF
MFRFGRLAVMLAAALLGAGCAAPLSLISFAGSTAARTAHNYSEAEKEEAPKRQAIAEANVALAVEYMRQGRYQDAIGKLEKAKHAEPRHAATYSMFGLLYQRLGQAEPAEANFRKSLQLDKGNPEYLNNYGQFLCSQGRFADAEKTFLEAALDPLYVTPEVAYANAGICALADGDRMKARRHLADALERDPALPTALFSMSEIEYAAGAYAAADQYFDRYDAAAEHTPRSLWLGIRIKQRSGDLDALASYTLLLRGKFPHSDEALLLSRPGGLQEALAMEQAPRPRHAGLLGTFDYFNEPELLTERDLLDTREN